MSFNSSLKNNPIAVIGLSSIFADARNVEEFWTNIVQSKDSITDVPANRWLIEDYYDANMFAPDKTYCKRGGFLPDIDFNPIEFGLPPNILEVTDASQLLGLVAARDAFEDAGYGQKSPKFTKELKEKTGVLLGVGGGQKLITPLIARLQYPIWERALRASGVSEEDIPRIVDKMKKAYVSWNENAFPGLLGNVISGRITNRFDLGGINSVVDAACAASLSAVKMALSELVEGRCDMMLTGGVDTDNSPFMYMSFSKTPAFSKSGNIRPFSDDADGMLIGEGIGMLVLKRLADAERDGDQIYATITGVGTSSDGRFKSVYAPRPAGQALAMNRAYEDAGYAPSTVGLLEGHGTGTGAGDPTEFTSMQMVFGADNPKKQSIALGSVKSQIGHTKSAAGAAGIVKMVLALHHKILPPTINVEKPNEKFDIKNSAMYINTETRPWMRNGHPRRAGVSAFGFGGINVHITLEEYTGKKDAAYRMHEPFKSVVLQAESSALLQQNCQNLIAELQGEDADLAFENVVRTSKTQVLNPNQPRLGFVVTDIKECIDFLNISIQNLKTSDSEWMHPKGIFFRNQSIDTTKNKVVALFAGQGAQYVGMSKELANAFPEVAETFAKADELFVKNGEKALSTSIFPIPVFTKEEREAQQIALTQTQIAQPAIGTLSMGQYKVLQNAGFKPHFTAGHSFGELTALWAAGAYDDATFLNLAKTRGASMALQNSNDAGAMLAVKSTENEVRQAIAQMAGVQIANVNSNNQIILGGSSSAISAAETQLRNQGFSVVPLPVAAAFHTPFVAHAQKPFASFLATQNFTSPKIPVFANSTGQAYPTDVASLKTILENQILNPVLFKNQIENIHDAGGRIFIEFGPKGILTSLVKNILENKEHTAIALNPNAQKDSDLQFRQAVVQMQVLGLSLQDFDPHKKEMTPLPPKSKLNVKLSGYNYLSAETQKTYDDVMSDGFKIKGGGTQIVEKIVEKIVNVEKIVEKIVEVPSTNGVHKTDKSKETETLHLLQETLNAFKANQSKALAVFENFMSEQNRQGQQIINLIEEQLSNKSSNGAEPIALPGNIKVAPFYSNPPAETLDRTPHFPNGSSNGKSQAAHAIVSTAAVSNGALQTAIAPSVTVTNGASIVNSNLTSQLLAVVSEKTGYPAEMLELGMDMEADLGIDSIKRVEIFGALTQQNPSMSGINPNELTELRTLQEIVDYVSSQSSNGVKPVTKIEATPSVNGSATVQAIAPTAAVSNGAMVINSNLTAQLLAVVSEKTGYPAEMLELGMDMEADLGIDSIKRVEIFGALTQQNPSMSGINPNELTELRTLQEIVDYVTSHNSNGVKPVTKIEATPPTNGSATAHSIAPTAAVSNGATVINSNLTAQLLAVVSEKTGYPAEMLELGMDMEADLGIDSIKRVEIFGALTQQNPSMSGINPNELTELRTLQEIVDYVTTHNSNGVKPVTKIEATPSTNGSTTIQAIAPTAAVSNGATVSNSNLTSQLLAVVSEKTGYPAEMLELGMDMEADLGIDSIKRVEIFGALTQQNPSMSGINPNELTELRTLQEIVDYVTSHNSNGVKPVTKIEATPSVNGSATVQAIAPTPAVSNGATVSNSNLTSQLLAVVSEKTGYPAEMLELGMDMEADLGIDSIKRVEIFGALTQQNPSMSGINPNELTELRTLQEIVDYVTTHNSNGVKPVTKIEATPSTNGSTTIQAIAPTAAVSNGATVSNSNLTSQLLAVVSEKTGYPAEMLELGMDMEADLGIDSIKRVEIFGALTQQNPSMSGINPNELTELRTLQEIVDYVTSHNSNGVKPVTKIEATPSTNGSTTVQTIAPTAAVSNGATVSNSNLTSQLLAVVSEKTGYPAEMLELGMDMEADLGIDSIKRVEIFGALTQQNPSMSGINPNELTELRTLQEIVDYVSSSKKKVSTVISEKEIVQTKASVSTQGMVKTGAFHNVKRFEIGLDYLPQPDYLEFSLPETHHVLVTNEGTELTEKVITALQKDGMKVLVLNLPNVKNPISQNGIDLAENTDSAIASAIETIHSKYGKIGSFIHLHPHFEFKPGNFTQHFSAEKEIVKTLFFLAKHIQKDLNELGKTQRANFLSITRLDGQQGQGKRGNTSIIGGGIPGLVKCLNLEWSPVFCRAVDIQPELSADFIASQVIAELHDANTRIVEVAVSDQGRKTPSVIPADAPEFQEIQTSVTSDSVFFVSGGARGVTATCVVEMAKTFQNKFILLGRSSSTFEVPDFAKNENDESTLKRLIMNDLKEKGETPSLALVKNIYNEIVAKKEIDETLSLITNHGGKAIYIKGDITNLGSFKQELAQATTQLGKITGIIHGAGRLADKYIQDKTEADFENVLSVKLDGLLALLGSVNLNQLDHLILFSSVAGFYGNVGQTDYAIANEILSRAAHLFRTNHPKTHVSAINWGAWDSGMVSGELKTQFEAAGISLVNSEGGAAMLVNELNTAYANQPQVIIGGTLPAAVSYIGDLQNYRIRRNLSLEQNPYLTHHVIHGNAVLPVVNAVGWMAQSCELLYPDFSVFKIENTKLFKGLVFDEKIKSEYILEIKEIEKTTEKIVFETTVLSEGGKLPTFHYKSTVTLLNKKAILPTPKFSHKVSGNYTPIDGSILYKNNTLFHGAYFQGIQKVLDCNAEQIVLSCKAPEVPLSVQGQFAVQSINTFFADIQYQGMLVWVDQNKDGAKSLPLQTDDAIIYKQVPFEKELFVHIGIQSHSETQMIANCTVYDSEGNVYIETHGASVTVSNGLTW
jgi:acyl transferase domain-containing protein/acyl carrier protein/NADP-dependent 3-hydroxy acid dehydrogenase YdfG